MRMLIGTIVAAVVAAAVGIGWFAMRERDAATEPAAEALVGRKIPEFAPAKARRITDAPAAKAKPDQPTAESRESQRQAAKAEEKPTQAEGSEQQKKVDDPFPHYLDMFKNNPEALAAEFRKEAEADRARQSKMREDAIAKLKLNSEQAASFVKALDDLKAEVTRQNEEDVVLITSGQLNEDTAADGSIWSSNSLLMEKRIAVRNTAIRETAEKLYEQLALDGISDAEVQRVLDNVTRRTAFSYECFEPNLVVYDKIYKNMGLGNGIFSWCCRPHPQRKK